MLSDITFQILIFRIFKYTQRPVALSPMAVQTTVNQNENSPLLTVNYLVKMLIY